MNKDIRRWFIWRNRLTLGWVYFAKRIGLGEIVGNARLHTSQPSENYRSFEELLAGK
ncbi:MAG: hypothetical protein NC911_11135 [Candidatus Omnitrophica bacterium]|nr:hypothetical protein [Candidatus Omnitrophota bacterium]